MRKKFLNFLFISLIIGATAYGLLYVTSEVELPDRPASEESAAVAVEVEEIRPKDFSLSIEALGDVRPLRQGVISAEVGGKIEQIEATAELGSRVKQGQRLAKIDDLKFRIELQSTESSLEKARATYEIEKVEKDKKEGLLRIAEEKLSLADAEYARKLSLKRDGLISQQDLDASKQMFESIKAEHRRAKAEVEGLMARLDSALADVAGARARVESVKKAIKDALILAPFDGTIAEKASEIGEMVAPGQKLFVIMDISKVKVVVRVPSGDVGRLAKGQGAEIFAESLAGASFRGTVENIGVAADHETRSYSAEIVVDNHREPQLLPGMFARAKIKTGEVALAIVVPRGAVMNEDGDSFIFVANTDGSLVHKRKIKVERKTGKELIVKEGLSAGERVVTSGHLPLSDGSRISISTDSGPPGSASNK